MVFKVKDGIKTTETGTYFSVVGDISVRNILSEIVSSKLQDDLKKTVINNAVPILAEFCQDSIELD